MPIGIARKHRGWWRSPRVLLGIFLIILAMTLTFFALRFAGHMDRYWVAKDTILAGQSVTEEMLVPLEANPGTAAKHYFPVGKLPPLHATQTIAAGELLSRGSVTDTPGDTKKLVLQLAAPLPSGVEKGDYLEIWQLPADLDHEITAEDLPPTAQIIAARAVFVAEKRSGVAVRISDEILIEILVENEDLEAILAALGLQRSLVAIPVAS